MLLTTKLCSLQNCTYYNRNFITPYQLHYIHMLVMKVSDDFVILICSWNIHWYYSDVKRKCVQLQKQHSVGVWYKSFHGLLDVFCNDYALAISVLAVIVT